MPYGGEWNISLLRYETPDWAVDLAGPLPQRSGQVLCTGARYVPISVLHYMRTGRGHMVYDNVSVKFHFYHISFIHHAGAVRGHSVYDSVSGICLSYFCHTPCGRGSRPHGE